MPKRPNIWSQRRNASISSFAPCTEEAASFVLRIRWRVRAVHLRDSSAIGGTAGPTEPDQRKEKYHGA
jgi:hypothetical protein